MTNSLALRAIALLLHAALNFILVNWLINFDITGKWIFFIGFIIALLALLYFFVKHVIAFIYFLKTRLK